MQKKNQNLLSNTKLIPNIQNRHLGTIFGRNRITKIPLGSNLPYMANWGFSKLGFINIPKYLNKNQRNNMSNIIQNDNSFSYLKIV